MQMSIIGENIKTLRQKAGWTQTEIADKIGLSVAAVSKIESGITDINMSRIRQVAKLFDVSVAILLSGSNRTPYPANTKVADELSNRIKQYETDINQLQKKLIKLYEEFRN
jgi:transcriptional regulator with XRE-family HTH domain